MTRLVGVATLNKNISSCQIKNYLAALMNKMEHCAAADSGLLAHSEHPRIEARSRPIWTAWHSAVAVVTESVSMDETRPDQGLSGASSTACVDTANTVTEPVNLEVAKHDQGQSGVCVDTANAVMEPVNIEVARHDQGQTGLSGTASVDTANIVMEPATHADGPTNVFNQRCPTEWNWEPLQSPLTRG